MTLEELRAQIDAIDEELFQLLQDRLKVVGQVGHFKKNTASGKYIIRAGREALKVKKAFDKATDAGLDRKTAIAFAGLWREIIALSINHEDEANIAFNSSNSETIWKLREYIGPYTNKNPFKTDNEVLESLKSKQSNIAAFTVESKYDAEPWWVQLSKIPELAVFAEAPLFTAPGGSLTLMVSHVTPEPSGEDKFVYVISQKIPEDEADNFEVLSEYKNNYLVASEEFYNNYQSKLNAKYLGCFATFEF